MKRFLIVIISLFMFASFCCADDYTRIENISSMGQYIITPEFLIEVWDFDTDKSSCWLPSDRLIVSPRGYIINLDRDEVVRMVDIELRKNDDSTGLYDEIDREVLEQENR